MAMLNSLAKMVTKPLPRSISPKAHSIVDFITVGTFLAAAALFWRRNKRAAVGALVCGGADLLVSLLTDYPGGMHRTINYRTHREIDMGLAAMFATIPDFLAFKDDKERMFFLLQGAVMTALSETTWFPEGERPAEKQSIHTQAA